MDILKKIFEIVQRVCNLEVTKQNNIQFKLNGTNIGKKGEIETINITGDCVEVTGDGKNLEIKINCGQNFI